MRKKIINQIQEEVKSAYSAIAHEFSASRKVPWQEFNYFLAYIKRNAKVLDLGCGNGRLYEFLKPKKIDYLGIDHNSHLLEKAKEQFPEARFQLDDMIDLKLPTEAFNNIFCIAAFHHVPSKSMRKQVANSMHSTLKPDGILILTVWNLFQFKYIKALLKASLSFVLHLGFKYSWNDLWIKWGNYPIKRYYHAFRPKELLHYFPEKKWEIEEFYFTRKGNHVSFWRSFNLVLIARKK